MTAFCTLREEAEERYELIPAQTHLAGHALASAGYARSEKNRSALSKAQDEDVKKASDEDAENSE